MWIPPFAQTLGSTDVDADAAAAADTVAVVATVAEVAAVSAVFSSSSVSSLFVTDVTFTMKSV